MRVFLYKRTHPYDPDDSGRFGIYCCMRRARGYEFDAVVGIGGISPKPKRAGIAKRINWIGIGPHKVGNGEDGFPILGFEQFIKWEDEGRIFAELAPSLAKRMYSGYGVRYLMLDSESNAEIRRVLTLASKAGPSRALLQRKSATRPKPCAKTIGKNHFKLRSKNKCNPRKPFG